MIYDVEITKKAKTQLLRAPPQVRRKLMAWVEEVERLGLELVRKQPGFHDHPLKGTLAGKRAISLSKQWRGVYEIVTREDGTIILDIAEVQEVHPHDY